MNDKWEALMNRCKAEARDALHNNKSDGIAIVTMHIVTGYDGDPLVWIVPSARRVEPSSDAAAALQQILSGLSAD